NARGLRRLGINVDAVWTSPFVRAVRTAEILASELGIASRVRSIDALQPAGSFEALVTELRLNADSPGIALVGHEPSMGEFASYLLTGSRAAEIQFKKGGAACFELTSFDDPIRARFCWLMTPRALARIE